MTIKIFDSSHAEIILSDDFASDLFNRFVTTIEPRVSSCIYCNSCVVAYEPFARMIESINETNSDSELINAIIDFLENASSIHLYIWEENDCIHNLWLDPLFAEWSIATGEKRIRR